MAEHTWYAIENESNVRQLTVTKIEGTVGRAPSKEKKINISCRMILAGDQGSPEWIDNAFAYVAENHDLVKQKVEFSGYQLEFGEKNLFGPKGFAVDDCKMRAFSVSEFGERDAAPDVVLQFTIRIAYSKKRWQWLGEYNGELIFVKFTPGENAKSRATDGDAPGDDDEDEEAPPTAKSKKSGPKQLEAFHDNEVGAGRS